MNLLHSVRLDEELCRGCTNCLKSCPTEAIRVKKGKAFIIEERCVDCGECIRRCPFRAKKAHSDELSALRDFDFTIALPAPALYGQFPKGTGPDHVLEGLIRLGFDATLEVAFAAEAVSRSTRAYRREHAGSGPLISSSCPAVVRLIRNRFPDLLDRIIPMKSPMEIAAALARRRYAAVPGRVGVFFISPCAAKVTAIRDPLGEPGSDVDGVIGFSQIWVPLQQSVATAVQEGAEGNPPPRRSEAGFRGVSWARAEGEAEGAGLGETLAADGIGAVLEVLEALEDDRLEGIGFLELMACPGGCVGGPLTVENPYLARSRIRALEEEGREKGDGKAVRAGADENAAAGAAGVARAAGADAARGGGARGAARVGSAAPDAAGGGGFRAAGAGAAEAVGTPAAEAWRRDQLIGDVDIGLSRAIEAMPVFSLDEDYGKAMAKMALMDEIVGRLPGLDCGSCGSPSCKSLAEDIVRGHARETDCVFRLRDRIRDLTEEMLKLEEIMPPGLDRK
jgi:Na+-translocating ferredoxin:NAD+ oxidoreductase RNF subunit RnfB